ncbi:MAG: ATPase [Chroococcus sp. CMT-3BRIN-NPC107]|jgi:signal transduction histidine kinase|nr:ATPase [Chroococcus sp. CMT-3BRIN-NPC107]
MVSSFKQSLSLYELSLSTELPPQLLSVTPATLLALIRATIDLLIEQEIRAQIWFKLPPGKIWHSEIQRYSVANLSEGIYNCFVYKTAQSDRIASLISVKLTPASKLQREYFILVLSSQFCSLALAHRRRVQRQGTITKVLSPSKPVNKPKQSSSLVAICSYEPPVIERVLAGIKQEIVSVIAKNSTKKTTSSNQAQLTELLQNWDALFTVTPTSGTLISQAAIKQLQYCDAILRRAKIERATQLEQKNQELLNTVNLKNELLRRASQELRTPLTNMKTALSLLNSPHLKPPQRMRYLQMLHTECDRQSSVINGLLELLEIDQTPKYTPLQPVRLSEIVPGVVSTYQPLAQEKGIMLAYTLPDQIPPVLCFNSWLKQITINLLHNSIKFTPRGGQVWVRSRVMGDRIMLEVKDTGIGIAERDIARVFDHFYRIRPTADDSSGAGLGLTIVQQLLQRCGGSISIKSKLGEGATFTILLAIAPTLRAS